MPRIPQTVYQLVPQSSIQVAATTITAEMMFLNNGYTFFVVDNSTSGGGAATCTITVRAVADEAGRTGTSAASLALPNASIGYQTTVTTGTSKIFGPFRQAWWNQFSGNVGYVYIDASSNAGGGVFTNMAITVISN